MKIYLAESMVDGGKACHDFMARDWNHAKTIADGQGWTLLGTLEQRIECDPELESLLKTYVGRTNETVH